MAEIAFECFSISPHMAWIVHSRVCPAPRRDRSGGGRLDRGTPRAPRCMLNVRLNVLAAGIGEAGDTSREAAPSQAQKPRPVPRTARAKPGDRSSRGERGGVPGTAALASIGSGQRPPRSAAPESNKTLPCERGSTAFHAGCLHMPPGRVNALPGRRCVGNVD